MINSGKDSVFQDYVLMACLRRCGLELRTKLRILFRKLRPKYNLKVVLLENNFYLCKKQNV